MKILVLSDMNWDRGLQKKPYQSLASIKFDKLRKKYPLFNSYIEIINDENPELILFSGDITGDGSCGHGYQSIFKILLDHLDLRKIKSFYIRGDHDVDENVSEVNEHLKNLIFSDYIDKKIVEYKGLKILGLSFSTTKNKKELKSIILNQVEKVDILLTHTELKRRTWLFDLNTEIVITGHYDRKIVGIDDKLFIALDNDFKCVSYCVINFKRDGDTCVRYIIKEAENYFEIHEYMSEIIIGKRAQEFKINGKHRPFPNPEDIPSFREIFALRLSGKPTEDVVKEKGIKEKMIFTRGNNYKKGVERIRAIKHKDMKLSKAELEEIIKLRISRSMITDYAGIGFLKQ